MPTVDELLAVARSQLGVNEQPAYSNDVPYSRWMGMVGQPWCDMFVSWCFDRCGMGAAEGRWAYTPAHANNFAARSRWTAGTGGLTAGDVVFFDFPGYPYRISHVGFVEYIDDTGRPHTIEGNTNGAGSRDGGAVMRHIRTSSIVGYGRPAYDQEVDVPLSSADIDAVALLLLRYDDKVARPRELRTRRLLKAVAVRTGLSDRDVRAALDGTLDLGDVEQLDAGLDREQLAAVARELVPTIDDV